MDSYQALAPYYDRFTDDVPYDQWADFVERLFTWTGSGRRLCWTSPAAPGP